MKVKPITIKTAKEISNLGYDEVIIVGCHYESGIQHVTTYGKTQVACENAAIGGNQIKKLLKWPEDKCNAKPARQKKREQKELKESVDALCKALREDKELYYAYQANIAMSMHDEYYSHCKSNLTGEELHKVFNDSAKRFLDTLINQTKTTPQERG